MESHTYKLTSIYSMAEASRPLVDYEEEEEEEEERSSDEEYIVPKKRVRVQKTDEGKCFI